MSTKKLIKALGLIIVVALLAAALPQQAKAQNEIEGANRDVCQSGCTYNTIQSAIDAASAGDTILVSGTFVHTGTATFNKDVTLTCAANAKIQVSGTAESFKLQAGASIEGCEIEKTDKTGTHNIITLEASDVAVKNNHIHGQWTIGDNEISRAMVVYAGTNTGLEISGNEIWGLRQPAYISGTNTGTVSDNYVHGTKGWVIEGGNLTFSSNTFAGNVGDIAILSTVPSQYYTDILALSAANDNAVVEDQRVTPAVLSVAYVDDSAAAGGNGTEASPYQSIQAGINRVIAGGTVNVAAGTYYEAITINKPLTVVSTEGAASTIIHGGLTNPAMYVVTIRSSNVTFNGFTVTDPLYNVTPSADLAGIVIGYYGDNDLSNIRVTNNIVTQVGDPLRPVGENDWNTTAICVNAVVNGLEIDHNTIFDIHQTAMVDGWGPVGIGYYGYDTTPLSQNVNIHDNTIYDLSATGSGEQISLGIAAGWGSGSATIANNNIHDVDGRGIQASTSNNGTLQITGNTIDNTNTAVYLSNTGLGTLEHNKFLAGNTVAVENGATAGTLDASPNWWGNWYGPSAGKIDAEDATIGPWCADIGCATFLPDAKGEIHVPAGQTLTADILQTLIDNAPEGTKIFVPAATYTRTGGYQINKPHLTIILTDGTVIQNELQCFEINASNTTISGYGAVCKPTGNSNGIDVTGGLTGIVIEGLEIDGSEQTPTTDVYPDGIHFAGAITNFQIVNNYIHDLDGDGVEFTVEPTGEPMEIQGNLFQNNGGLGVNAGTFAVNAEYNSWGDIDGAAETTGGDGISANVDAEPWTHVDLYMRSTDQDWPDKVAKHQQISYTIYGNFQNVMGADFVLDYPETLLACLNCSDPTSGNPDPEGAFETETITVDATAGTIHYVGYNTTTDAKSGTAVALFTVTFEANDVGTGVLNLVETTDLFSMAPEGEPASSNIIYAAALVDGEVEVIDIFDVTGIFSMQGRVFRGDIPVTLTSTEDGFPYGPWTENSLNVLGINWSVSSLPAGGYLITTNQPRYLNLTAASAKNITIDGAKALNALMLRGGNVNNDDEIGLADAGIIGGVYGDSGDPLLISADANFDGRVNILDLALVGGNYNLISKTAYEGWSPVTLP